jgi:hypothetical protein
VSLVSTTVHQNSNSPHLKSGAIETLIYYSPFIRLKTDLLIVGLSFVSAHRLANCSSIRISKSDSLDVVFFCIIFSC